MVVVVVVVGGGCFALNFWNDSGIFLLSCLVFRVDIIRSL